MIRRLRTWLGGDAGRQRTLDDLRERRIIGILTTTGNPSWDARLNRTMILPGGIHLWTIDSAAAETAEGQMRLRLRAVLLNERTGKASENLPMPATGTISLLTGAGEVHTWDLTDLLQRADDGDDQSAEDLLELELHVQHLAMEAAMEGYEVPESMRWPDEA